MDKQPIVNINFTGITDYIRDKDLEVDFYRSKYNRLDDKVQQCINYINEMCLTNSGYCDYGDDLRPEHLIELLRGEINDR